MNPAALPASPPVLTGPPPPFGLTTMPQLLFFFLCVVFAIVTLVFILKRLLAWMDRRGWITYTGHVPTYGSASRAFLELQALLQPTYEYVIEAEDEQKEKKEEDDEGGPDKAGR